MLKKLKSLSKNHKGSLLTLAFKALIFSGLLYFSSAVSRWFLVIFLSAAFYFYFRSFLNSRRFLASFLVVIVVAVSSLSFIPHFSFLISLFSGFLFFLILGVKDLIFIHRQPLYYFLNGLLLLAVFICFFAIWGVVNPLIFALKYLTAFSTVFLLLKEFLTVSVAGSIGPQKRNLMAGGLSFGLVQLLWAISLLPFSFLNSASLALLAILILEDFAVHHLSGTMSRRIILRNATLFLILSLVIFAATRWLP